MFFIKKYINISIDNEEKRKKFLVNFFSFAALLSLSVFGIAGYITGKINYSLYILLFFSITLANIIFFKITGNYKISAHIIIILMFIFGIIVFSFLGVGVSGLFWFYTFPALTLSLTNIKKGTFYSFLLLISVIFLYFLKPEFIKNVYPLEIFLRFTASYIVLNILIIIFEYSRQKTQKALYKTLETLKETNEELITSEEELRTNNEELFSLNEQLINNEKRLNLAQKVGGIGIWEWFVEKDILIWSDTTYEIFGKKRTDKKITGDYFFRFVIEEDKKRLIDELNSAIKNKVKIHKTEYRIIKNNSIRYIEETSELIINNQGRLIKMIGVLQDITEKKKYLIEINEKNEELAAISEELRQSNEELQTAKEEIEKQNILLKNTLRKYNLISNSISDLIWMLDFDLKPLYISDSCKNFLGYTKDELINLKLSEFHTKKSFLLIQNLLKNAISLINTPKAAKGITAEIEYIRKDGSIVIAEVKAYLIFDDDNNKAIAIGGISRDITKRKKIERDLAETNKAIAIAHKDILDNLKYAKKIQNGLLTKTEFINSLFDDYFLIFKQRFSVGGDFYYINKINDYIVFAVGDCTGHGVPGGLLTMISIAYLHEIIRADWIKSTGETLNVIRKRFKRIFKDDSQSGFNIALCAVNTKTNILQFSGAYNPLIIIRDDNLTEYKATRNPIGYHFIENDFETKEIQLQKNDKLYIFSDGYYDQISPEGVKIGKKMFKQLLSENNNLPFEKQKNILINFLEEWKGKQIQIDDITVLGINWNLDFNKTTDNKYVN